MFEELGGDSDTGLTFESYRENIDKAISKYDWYTLGEDEEEDEEEGRRFLFKVESKNESPDFQMDTDREYLRNTRKTKVKSEDAVKIEL